MEVKVKKLHPEAVVPSQATEGASGFDLVATSCEVIMPKGEPNYLKYGTGLAFEIPEGYELQVRPRSSIGKNTDLIVVNSPGTVDADYRGEVFVVMKSISKGRATTYQVGERIAQAVIQKVEKPKYVVVEELSETKRGTGAEGSTGR